MTKDKKIIDLVESEITYFKDDIIRILSNEIIYYYHKYGIFSIADFISYISNKEELIKIFSEIISMNLKEKYNKEEIYDYIKVVNSYPVNKKGIFNCCQLNQEMIRKAVELGYYISFAGPITFKNVKNADDCVKIVPMDKILIETDSPYLSPEPYRGKRNDSRNVKYVAQKIAEIKVLALEEVAKITYENAMRIFEI